MGMFTVSKKAQEILERLYEGFDYHCSINAYNELIIKHAVYDVGYVWIKETEEEMSKKDYDDLSFDEQWELCECEVDEFTKDFINNHSFRLEDVNSEFELKCKVIEWLSRPSIKGGTEESEKFYLKGVNHFLGTNFTREEMDLIYTRLGNNVNRTLCEEFINSSYDLEVLKKK